MDNKISEKVRRNLNGHLSILHLCNFFICEFLYFYLSLNNLLVFAVFSFKF
jgi:hypothetical protein